MCPGIVSFFGNGHASHVLTTTTTTSLDVREQDGTRAHGYESHTAEFDVRRHAQSPTRVSGLRIYIRAFAAEPSQARNTDDCSLDTVQLIVDTNTHSNGVNVTKLSLVLHHYFYH